MGGASDTCCDERAIRVRVKKVIRMIRVISRGRQAHVIAVSWWNVRVPVSKTVHRMEFWL